MTPKAPRGFAHPSMTPERRREIAAMGGRAGAGTVRGFAKMDTARVQEIARKGGQVSKKPLTPTE